MKGQYFHSTNHLFIFLSILVIFLSCEEKSQSVLLLSQAQSIVNENPEYALSLLDSIPEPNEMGKDHYMQFIVTHVQAKYKTYKDITNDTLILEAQRYFDNQKNLKQASLAHFYAAWYNYEKGKKDKALEYFLHAANTALQSNDEVQAGMSYENMAKLYYEQDMNDSALVNYRKAIQLYNKNENSDKNKLSTYSQLGNIFFLANQLDSAKYYYKNGLDLASSNNDRDYRSIYKHHLGVIYLNENKYKVSSDYLHEALSETTNTEDSLRLYMNLAVLHNVQNRVDSTTYYLDKISNRLTESTDNYIQKYIYGILRDYSTNRGNFEDAYSYQLKYNSVDELIKASNNAKGLVEANYNYQKRLKQNEIDNLNRSIKLCISIAVLILLVIILVFSFNAKSQRQKQKQEAEEKRRIEAENELLNKNAELAEKECEVLESQNQLLEADKKQIESHNQLLESQNLLLEADNKLLEVDKKLLESGNKLLLSKNELLEKKNDHLIFMQNIYRSIFTEWTDIDNSVKELAEEFGATEVPELYLRITAMVDNFRQQNANQYLKLAKEYFKDKPFGEKALQLLNEKEQLLFILYYSGYSRREASIILNVNSKKGNMDLRKLTVRNKLFEAGMQLEEAYKILYSDKDGNPFKG